MKLSEIVQKMGETGTITRHDLTRREIAKLKSEWRKPTRRTSIQYKMMQPRAGRSHEHKVRWPVRDETFVLETERRVRDARVAESPLITARRRQYDPKVKSNRTR